MFQWGLVKSMYYIMIDLLDSDVSLAERYVQINK